MPQKEKLRQIEMRIKANSKDNGRIERMFKAYWKVSKENAKEMVENPFDEHTIPAWVETKEDAAILVPYILPYMLGKTKSLPHKKEDAIAESFVTDDSQINETVISMDEVDTMDDEELEETFRQQTLKEMDPKEAEKVAYETIKNMSNANFDDKFYDSVGYMVMSFAQQAIPEATPDQLRNLGVEMKQSLPPAISQLQMEARSILRKVEATKGKDMHTRRSRTLKQLQKRGTIRLDREGYLKSLPEHKKVLMESFAGTKENFGLLGKIFGAILNPVIKGIVGGLMPLITGFINIAVKAVVGILPTIVNDVLIPLVHTVVQLLTSIFTNQGLIKALVEVIRKVIDLAIEIGFDIIKALSIPIITLFFKYVMPLLMVAVRFVIFIFRMLIRISITVWNLIVSFVKSNWSYILAIFEWVVQHVIELLTFIYKFAEPYITYTLYIVTPIALVGIIVLIGPNLFTFLNTLVSLGMTSTPERTFRPTKALVDAAS